jgi:hypothetical protein
MNAVERAWAGRSNYEDHLGRASILLQMQPPSLGPVSRSLRATRGTPSLERSLAGLAIAALILQGCTMMRLDEPGRRAILFARQIAVERGAPTIDTEHLLLGVLRADPDLARRLAHRTNLDTDTFLRRIEAASPSRPKLLEAPADMPLSPAAKEALSAASHSVSYGLHSEDVLVALTEVTGVAATVLKDLGVTAAMIREEAAAASSTGRDTKSRMTPSR